MTFNSATYSCAVCVYLQGFEEFFKCLEFLHQLTNAYTKTQALWFIDSWVFWQHIFNPTGYLLLNVLTTVNQSLFTLNKNFMGLSQR